MIPDLQAFIELLRREDDVAVIRAEVDPHLEAAEIHRRVIEQGGKALLFTNIKGAHFPLVTNLFGTKKRVELAFGTRPERLIREVASFPRELLPPTLPKLWSKRQTLFDLAKVGLKHSPTGPALEVKDSPAALERLPLLTTWEKDGGAFITLPLVYTEHPTTKIPNLGMYRMQRFDGNTTGLHCQIGKGGGFHIKAAEELGVKLPVNVTIGGPPALILSAIAPLPENVPELLLASLVLGSRLPLVPNPLGPLPVIATAEFTLVGEVDPNERRPEGPFGDHYGYYSLQHDYPVFHVSGLLHRKNAVCAATVVGKPRQEDFYLGDYLQELLSPLFPIVMPAVKDLWSYGETGYHALAAAVVQERYKREALVSAFRILGEGQLALTKFLLLTNQPMDLKNFPRVLEHILERTDPRTDLFLFSNLSMDTLDYSGPTVNEGSKGVLLGIGEPKRSLPHVFNGRLPSGIRRVKPFCGGVLVIEGDRYQTSPDFASRIVNHPDFAGWQLLVLVDDVEKATANTQAFLWTTFTRFDPAADIKSAKSGVVQNHITHEFPLAIDARMKPWYPDELESDPKTKELVDRRWNEYFS